MNRLVKKMETAARILPSPQLYQEKNQANIGIIFYGTTRYAAEEALDLIHENGTDIDALRIKAFPFHEDVKLFLENHDQVFIIEQNRDAQMRSLIINELEIDPKKLKKILNFDGTPITADFIIQHITSELLTPKN
jgi:2-oxoglutarate ferredoxin oxidoreductase subunit alpha